jgi:diguanylate cyclase (GGDEF)-like protein
MRTTADWGKQLENLCAAYERTVKTQTSVAQELAELVASSDSPITAVNISFTPTPPFDAVNIGEIGQGPASHVHTFQMGGTTCRVSWWSGSALPSDKPSLEEHFTRLAHAFWKPQLRDHKSHLLSLQYQEANDLLENALASFPERAYVLFTDLDHFKEQVNDKYGQDGGDQAILQFSAVVDSAIRPDAIPIHRSGDEFCAVLISSSADNALNIAGRLMKEAQRRVFSVKGNDVSLGITIGLARSTSPRDSYAEIEPLAVEACKPDGVKQRGKITFSGNSGLVAMEPMGDLPFAIACCLVRSKAADEAPFSNVVLNFVSRSITESIQRGDDLKALQEATDKALRSTTAIVTSGLMQAAIPNERGACISLEVSPLDVGLAIAHGLFRSVLQYSATITGTVDLLFDSKFESCDLQVEGTDYVHLGSASSSDRQSRTLGGFITTSRSVSANTCSRALLVRIGHTPTPLPAALFAETVVVDDRPTTGGGLPDFWEATVARIVGQLDRNPNIRQVYVLGEQSSAALTVQRLRDVERWTQESEQMAFKTGMPADKIRSASQRLTGRIAFCGTPDEIVTHLEPSLMESWEIQPLVSKHTSTGNAFLDRQLQVSSISLKISDGCRLDTISQAYPVVVEIVRTSGQCWLTKDQAGVELRELTDFKVQLSRPLDKQVPAFYENEHQSLKEYFDREFLSENGTFGKVFAVTGQIDPVIRHVCDAIRTTHATTRRGIIIIPHIPAGGTDLAPLGLVCIRIVPRISEAKVRFDFSFVWRTVEVLVGFPYSLFGSVKFSEHLTSLLRKNLSADDYQVELGEVSYTAQSLHMFGDEYGQIIARRIVNDATL